jgi:hypothetical protein
MTKVFIGGSRAVSRLNGVIRAQLDDLISKDCTILVGDANGADRAVQQHFADRNYRKVIVFCMAQCRNNVGKWNIRSIVSVGSKRGFEYYAEKDRAMAHESRCGVMLWDGRSRGTLNNILNLLREGKKTLVYFSPTKVFHKLSTEDDFRLFLAEGNGHRKDHPASTPKNEPTAQTRQLFFSQTAAGHRR